MSKLIQLKDNTGIKQYPITSSEAVGMSDNSGSLDKKLSDIDKHITSTEEITCTAINSLKNNVDNLGTVVKNNETAVSEQISNINKTLEGKQELLISGENIKTINNTPILGSGNITIESSSNGLGKKDENTIISPAFSDYSNIVKGEIFNLTETLVLADGKRMDANEATGMFSHSEGYKTKSKSDFAHAEGNQTTASGLISHAEGFLTTASGEHSHTEGFKSIASGKNSHAEGFKSIASGNESHAEGTRTNAAGDFSHMEGSGIQNIYLKGGAGSTEYEICAGMFNLNKDKYLIHRIKKDFIIEFNNISAKILSSRFDSNTNKFYIKLDKTLDSSNPIDDTNKECTKIIINVNSGNGSHAEGQGTVTANECGHAEGDNTVSIGSSSHAENKFTYALGNYSHAEGVKTHAEGIGSHAEGNETTASGDYSHAEGNQTTASGIASHAGGLSSTASGDNSFSFGQYNESSGIASSAIGEYNIASGEGSVALGIHATSLSKGSAAIGRAVTAKGNGSVALNGGYFSVFLTGSGNTKKYNVCYPVWWADYLIGMKIYLPPEFNTPAATVQSTVIENNKLYINVDKSLNMTLNATPLPGQFSGTTGDAAFSSNVSIAAGGWSSSSCFSIAAGNFSHSEGQHSIASGEVSHVEGWQCESKGLYTHAEGGLNYITGDGSHAENNNSHKIQLKGNANATRYEVTGPDIYQPGTPIITYKETILEFFNSCPPKSIYIIENGGGNGNRVFVKNAEISNNTLYINTETTVSENALNDTNDNAHLLCTVTGGINSHNEGVNNISAGDMSHTSGYKNMASSIATFACGGSNISKGAYSFTTGISNIANATASSCFGMHTVTNNFGQTSIGVNNVPDVITENNEPTPENILFSVGNSLLTEKRRDALRLLYNGNLYLPGIGSFTGEETQENIQTAKSLQQTIQDINTSIENINKTLGDINTILDKINGEVI